MHTDIRIHAPATAVGQPAAERRRLEDRVAAFGEGGRIPGHRIRNRYAVTRPARLGSDRLRRSAGEQHDLGHEPGQGRRRRAMELDHAFQLRDSPGRAASTNSSLAATSAACAPPATIGRAPTASTISTAAQTALPGQLTTTGHSFASFLLGAVNTGASTAHAGQYRANPLWLPCRVLSGHLETDTALYPGPRRPLRSAHRLA